MAWGEYKPGRALWILLPLCFGLCFVVDNVLRGCLHITFAETINIDSVLLERCSPSPRAELILLIEHVGGGRGVRLCARAAQTLPCSTLVVPQTHSGLLLNSCWIGTTPSPDRL